MGPRDGGRSNEGSGRRRSPAATIPCGEDESFEFDIDAIIRELEQGPGFAPATLLPVICRALEE